MDSYHCRIGIRRGWRGGVDSRLTAVINHLPRQPDAGWQEGARWLEWRFVHSLPEMSSCQPVSGGMLSVINPSDHISINYCSRVKPACDVLHFTAVVRSCGIASLIFSDPAGSFSHRNQSASLPNISLSPKLQHIKHCSELRKTFLKKETILKLLPWKLEDRAAEMRTSGLQKTGVGKYRQRWPGAK